MNFRKVNNITGWIVFAIAALTYILTREATASLWDTGEFIASAHKLQLPHPPGAPLFTLLGRTFIIFFGGDNPANAVNLMSALASAFTILFLFWTITHFARKMFVTVGETLTTQQTVTVMGSGVVGALAYTFSDSFWYSAVEGEVYALSSFFTALVFWAMLKWEHASDLAGDDRLARARADRWIVFIFMMMGLSIGVHLLNLLTIPAIVVIFYFKRYQPTKKGTIFAFLIGCLITGLVQVVVIKWSVKLASKFDVLFVNSFGLSFFTGFIFFFILVGLLVWFGLRAARKNNWSFLRLGIWCFVFMMVGYSMYSTTIIRSLANPSIDMNNVDNPMSLVYYLGREQYGEAPLVYGPHFQAAYKFDENGSPYKWGETMYTRGKDENGKDVYIDIGKKPEIQFEDADKQLFPRIWDRSNDQNHAEFYADWLGLEKYQSEQGGEESYEAPTYADNMKWFFTYQMGLMYWRYFMWNFSGKQNDIQGFGNKRDGNWITGISFIDNLNLGDQSKLPSSIQNNKANNKLFLIPFILGILGCVYQFIKNKKDWIVTFLLFFFTGLAIVLYLNQPGNQPRERDYAFVGSFYAYAIWIGLAVTALVRLVREKADKQTFTNTLVYGGVLSFVVVALSLFYGTGMGAIVSSLLSAALYAGFTALAVYLIRALSSGGNNWRMANIVTIAVCLIAPFLMSMREWNDHDRSEKTIARDLAINYLESCEKNAILFTFGDNDTYPLWYAQEVEGVRPDIRIINNSLLGIDWYVNQLRYKVNESDPIDVIWTAEQIEGPNREYLRYQPRGNQNAFYNLLDVMRADLGKDERDPETGRQRGPQSFPVKRFIVPTDSARQFGAINPNDSLVSPLAFEIPPYKNSLFRNELVILNIIAANKWKRPIYFTHPYGELGFGQYIRKEGMSYRLVPFRAKAPQNNWVVEKTMRQMRYGGSGIRDNNSDTMFSNLMTHFRFGGADKEGMYFDEENRRHLLTIRSTFAEAAGNLADEGRKQEANTLLEHIEKNVKPSNLPYAMVSRDNMHNLTSLIYLEAAYKAGNTKLSETLRNAIKKDLDEQKAYYDYMQSKGDQMFTSLKRESDINGLMMFIFDSVEAQYNPNAKTNQIPPVEGAQPQIQTQAQDTGVKKDTTKP